MIYNIVDNRERRYRWRKVNAIIEATSHDNSCQDSDQQPSSDGDVIYEQRANISVLEAVEWATAEPTAVTLFLYDEGKGFTADPNRNGN